MSEDDAPTGEETTDPLAVALASETGGLLDPEVGDALEAEDRKKPIPGGEPDCPLCAATMIRRVEKYPAPRGGSSPFRVRLLCPDDRCGAWTVYDW